MRRVPILLVLIAISLLIAVPAIANSSEAIWQVGIVASNPDTLVSPDRRYCLMPDTMPLRPGNEVTLQDADHHLIGTVQLEDAVAKVGPIRYPEPRQPCELMALFQSVVPQPGLRLVIKADSANPALSGSSSVTINAMIQAYRPFDWWYDEDGIKRCQLQGNVRLTDDSPVMTSPNALLVGLPEPQDLRVFSTVLYDPFKGEEYCALMASLEFPNADEYVIEFGGEAQAEVAD